MIKMSADRIENTDVEIDVSFSRGIRVCVTIFNAQICRVDM